MKNIFAALGTILLCLSLPVPSAPAATLMKTWTLAGGGLDPATYGGAYRPAAFIPDAITGSGATISTTNLTTGGIGSSTFPEGYGGIYTFFSPSVGFTLNTTSVLAGIETITLSFSAGGGSPTPIDYGATDLTLNFNLSNTNVANTSFSKSAPFVVSTPIGNQTLSIYTWTWDVSTLGGSSAFSLGWSTSAVQEHAFFTDFNLTQQSVPEPSTYALIALGLGGLWMLRRFNKKTLSA